MVKLLIFLGGMGMIIVGIPIFSDSILTSSRFKITFEYSV